MDVSASLLAQQALSRQAAALSAIKQSSDSQQFLAEVIEQAAHNVPVSGTRGVNVDISA